MEIAGKNIILTGASSGIGFELLKLLLRHNDVKVIAVARHIDTIPLRENSIIYPFAADASTTEGVDSIFDYAKSIFGDVDIFIANAGFAYLEKLEKADWEHISHIFDLNVFSPIYALEKLVENNPSRNKTFVCTISGAGLAALPGYSLYCSTKAALHHFVKTYRYEKAKNIQITVVYPVATRTAFFDKASEKTSTPLPFPQQSPETVAKAIIKGIEKGKESVYPSLLFRLFYPLARAFPFLLNTYSYREKRKVAKSLFVKGK